MEKQVASSGSRVLLEEKLDPDVPAPTLRPSGPIQLDVQPDSDWMGMFRQLIPFLAFLTFTFDL